MPFLPAPLSVTAMTMATWPFLPLVMNCLTPLITYSSPCFTAVVRNAEASDPHMRLGQAERAKHLATRQRR